jgi:hypothetical protein
METVRFDRDNGRNSVFCHPELVGGVNAKRSDDAR